MTSPTERLRIMNQLQKESGLGTGDVIRLLTERYNRIEGWWCRDCEIAVTSADLAEHERSAHKAEP